MASGEQNITALPVKTNTGVANSDYFMGIDSAEGYQILIRDLAKYIMENYNGSTLAGQAQTPKAAIDALNSRTRLSMTYESNPYVTETDFSRMAAIKSLINSMNGLKRCGNDREKTAFLKSDNVLVAAAGYNFNEARRILMSMVDKISEEPGEELYKKAMIALYNIEKFSDVDSEGTIWELILGDDAT